MKIAVEGCAHGELEKIYDILELLQEKEGITIDLLICCGDFQASRNKQDLRCMAVPPSYCRMCSFYKYYNGEKKAPILTIFIGGNHEASNYLQELPYGGWVAPNIYYLGYAGVINIAGVRIGGLSGIFKGNEYLKGHFEVSPYNNDTKRSVYHVRNLEVFRLKHILQPIDVFLSHDWPQGIWHHGNVQQLLKKKPFFRDDIASEKLGNKPCKELLEYLKPQYWFSAHLHCKFAALVEHPDKKLTRFLALDKCLPNRRFLQITEIPHDSNLEIQISYDLEWLTILSLTNNLLSVKPSNNYIPGPKSPDFWKYAPTDEAKAQVLEKFSNNLVVPKTFVPTAAGYRKQDAKKYFQLPLPQINPQTVAFCSTLGVDDPLALLSVFENKKNSTLSDYVWPNGEDSLEEDSDLYETFIKNTPSKKLSLSLPEPKFNQSENLDDCLSNELMNSALSAIDESTVGSSQENNSVTTPEGDVNDESGNLTVSDPCPSVPKKFKRRNADIYCSEET